MKLLMGVIGFFIFAISLPAASQSSDGNDLARSYFFERTLKSTKKTYSCDAITVLAVSDKVAIVKGLNEAQNLKLATIDGRTEFTFQRATDAARITSLVESNSIGLCQTLKHQATAKAAAAAATQTQLNAALAANNALNRTGAAGAAGGSSGSSAAGGLATGAAVIGLLKGARSENADIKKDAAAEEAAAKAELDRRNGGTAAAAAAPPNTVVPGSAAAATAGTTNGAAAATATAGNAAATISSTRIVGFGDQGGSINVNAGTINLPSADGKTEAVYTWSNSEKKFTSPDGPSLDTMEMQNKVGGGPEIERAVADTAAANPAAGEAARAATSSAGSSAVDKLAETQKAELEASIKALETQNESVGNALTPGTGTQQCIPAAQRLKTTVVAYIQQLKLCSNTAIVADNLCSISRSPKARQVQLFTTLASGLLAKEQSAANNCKGAGYYAGIAQTGMVAANLACSGVKFACDGLCASTLTTLETKINAGIASLVQCGQAAQLEGQGFVQKGLAATPIGAALVERGTAQIGHGNNAITIAQQYAGLQKQQVPIVNTRIVQCKKYEADILEMGIQILSLQQNRKEAKACKDALARANAGGKTDGSTNKVADLTMDQFCLQPGQAAVAPCKCRSNNNAEGCPGFIAETLKKDTSTTNGAATAQMGMGGAANMASVGGINGAMAKMNGGKKSGLSSEARAALGLSDIESTQGSSAGQHSGTAAQGAGGEMAAGIESGGGGANGAAGSDSGSGSVKKADGKEKFGKFETISGGGGGSFGGFGGFGKFGTEKIDPKTGKKIPVTAQEAAAIVQRKIAAQEFQEQVTTASGKSNWDKVRERYDDAKNSLFDMP